jgi:outer membrane protein assembly factor BamB
VGAFPHNLANSSPVALDDMLYICTGNGQDESHVNIPSPKAPALIALDRKTGKLLWEDASPGDRILHGQWSTPAVADVGGVMQVVHGQGEGWVRGFDARTGVKLWEFDTNPKDAVWPKTRNEVIATPVIYDNKVFIANGQDPEHGEGVGHLYAIDATKRGDITESGRIWHFDKIRRSISTASIKDGLIYYPDFSGFLHALDVKTGQPVWTHDMFAAMWSSAMVVDGKVYLGDEDGDVVVFQHGREKKILAENLMPSSVYSTVVTANGAMFVMTRNELFAIQEGAQLKR